ncbi:MAG: DUF6252 family protein [Ginsengibacter sp.]
MKKILFILPAFFFTLIFATCKKNPPPSYDFYFTCKINGQTYIPGLGNGLTCELLADTTLLLAGNLGYQAIGVGINDYMQIRVTTYILNGIIGRRGDYKNSTLTNDRYFTDSLHTGQLNITTLDKTNKIIQGTFYFKAYNAYRNDSVSVTEGKFRLHYIIS